MLGYVIAIWGGAMITFLLLIAGATIYSLGVQEGKEQSDKEKKWKA